MLEQSVWASHVHWTQEDGAMSVLGAVAQSSPPVIWERDTLSQIHKDKTVIFGPHV